MYFSRIILNPEVNNQNLIQEFRRNVYKEHQMLWRFFDADPKAKRDFLYRQIIENSHIKYYLLSKSNPKYNGNIWNIKTKKYSPNLKKNQKLSFMLRANPVVTISDSDKKKKRHDIVMHTKIRLNYKNLSHKNRPSLQNILQESGTKWIRERANKNGFSVNSNLLIHSYQKYVGQASKGQRVEFRSIDFDGHITIIDPDLFKTLLFKGIGKSKSFGCGLFLIKKI